MVTLSLTFDQLAGAAKQLSTDEKIHLTEILWDDDKMNIPENVQKEVLRRLEKMEKHPEMSISSDEFHKRIELEFIISQATSNPTISE